MPCDILFQLSGNHSLLLFFLSFPQTISDTVIIHFISHNHLFWFFSFAIIITQVCFLSPLILSYLYYFNNFELFSYTPNSQWWLDALWKTINLTVVLNCLIFFIDSHCIPYFFILMPLLHTLNKQADYLQFLELVPCSTVASFWSYFFL